MSDVYYVAGVYGEESRYNNEQMTWYAQAVSLADGSVSDIELDKTNAGALENFKDKPNGGYEEVRGLYTFDDDVADVWGKNTDNGLVADNYRIYGFNPGATSVNDRLHTALSSDGLAMDDSRFSTTGAVSKTFYVDENTQYLGVDATKDTADDIDTVYSVLSLIHI